MQSLSLPAIPDWRWLGRVGIGAFVLAASAEQIEFFESRVRPVLANHCHAGHCDQVEFPSAGSG